MEGFEIPIGADFTAMQAAFDRVIQAVNAMGDKIVQALEKSSAAAMHADASMGKLQTRSTGLAAAQNQAGAATSAAASKFAAAASIVGNLGNAVSGAGVALRGLNTASRLLSGVNLATSIAGWVRGMGGLRGALTAIPALMRKILTNRTFQVIAATAVTAYAAVITIRTAFRIVTSAAGALKSAATATFHGMVTAARAAARAIGSAFSTVSSLPGKVMGAIPALPIAGILSAAGAIGLAVTSIGKAADMETLETAFAPLLGGAAAAKQRIAELAAFAAATPFELPEIAAASRTLQTLTKGALATGAGLRLVGDVAAGVNAPFEEISVTIGRLYDGLQSGRPVGEAMMRLQELGAISGATRSRIEDLQKSGAAGPAVWNEAAAALNKFGGSMERQSQTWNGKLSTFRDAVSMVMTEFGKPINDALKPWLDLAIARVETLKASAVKMGEAVRNVFETAMAAWQTGNIAELFGAGLQLAIIDGINSFSSGIRKTVAYLGAAMVEIMASVQDSWGASEFLGILKNLGEALAAMISAAILNAIKHIPGLGGLEQDAKREANVAKNKVNQAGNRLADFDGAAAVQSLVEAIKRINEKGSTAAAGAGNENVIDRTKAAAAMDAVMIPLNAWIAKSREAAAAAAAAMDAKLNQPNTDNSPTTAVSKAVSPAVMSLTRIGGGGFANSVAKSQLGEARRQTAYLRTIAGKKTPDTATAVYA